MSQKAELQYETIKWDKSLLRRAGKKPAGPLFNIKCSEDAVAHLHLPHCASNDGKTLQSCYCPLQAADVITTRLVARSQCV